MPGIHHLHPEDLFPIVHKGENRVVQARQLVDLIASLIGDCDHPGVRHLIDEAKNLAAQAQADAAQALRNVCEALAKARSAYELYLALDNRTTKLEQDVYVLKKLNNIVLELQREVNYITNEINKLKDIEITVERQNNDDSNFTTYIVKKDGIACPEGISVPKNIKAFPDAPEQLNDLNDVTLTRPSQGQVLYYDGNKWVNSSLTTLVQNIVNQMGLGSLWEYNNNDELTPKRGLKALRVGPVYSQD